MREDSPWVSASDLAEYSYCPRAHWYRDHPPVGRPIPGADRLRRRGRRFHRRALQSERRREEHVRTYVALALTGAGLLAIALYLAGIG